MRRKLIFGFLALILVAGGIVAWMISASFSPASDNSEELTFTVEQGVGVKDLGRALEEQGLIKSPLVFYGAAFVTGRWSSIQAGEYRIAQNATPLQILYMVSTGDIVDPRLRVTLIEGWTAEQMAQELEEQGVVSAEDYIALVENPEGIQSDVLTLIPEGKSLEGFLFPDTYLFDPDVTAQEVIEKQLRTFENKVYFKYGPGFDEETTSTYETMILASIVEREVAPEGDRAVVAGIFWNRLENGIALQSDATVNYVTGKGLAAPTYEDTRTESPYNTYLYPGLPPGPISNPGESAVDATLHPEETNYLYFLNDEEGNIYYAETFEEHKQNKALYL